MAKLHTYDEDISFCHIDEHAEKGQRKNFQNLGELVSYLSECIPQDTNHREILLTRGFLVWYTDSQDSMSTSEELNLFHNQYFEHERFDSFCQCADIESKQIPGKLKCRSSDSFERDFSSYYWNAFKVNNTWHLVNPLWCVSSTVGYNAGGVVALEGDGNTDMTNIEFCAGYSVNYFEEEWFCTNPNMFLYRHLPDDPAWQVLPSHDSVQPMSYEMWSNLPFLYESFFEHSLRLLSEESLRLKTINGKTTIMLMGKDVEKCTFPYKLYLKESDASTINPSDLPRLVLPGREGDIFKFEIRFPMKGTYFIDVRLGDIQSETSDICAQFMIECDEADPNCRKLPVDTGIMGFGYGPMAEEAGLKKPPIKGSKLVLKSEAGKQNDNDEEIEVQKIKFKLDVDAINEYEYVSNMYENENQKQVSTTVNESLRQLEIIPPVRPDSEYALVLNHRRKHTIDKFKPALYYMVSTGDDDIDESQTLVLQKRKEILHEEKMQEKMEKNVDLKEKIRTMKAAIDSLSMKGSGREELKEVSKDSGSLETEH